MTTAIKSQKQLARLDQALNSGTLADVAGIVSDLSPGDVAHLISSSPPRYRHVLWHLLESEQEAEVLNQLPEDLRNAFWLIWPPKRLLTLLDNSMTTM